MFQDVLCTPIQSGPLVQWNKYLNRWSPAGSVDYMIIASGNTWRWVDNEARESLVIIKVPAGLTQPIRSVFAGFCKSCTVPEVFKSWGGSILKPTQEPKSKFTSTKRNSRVKMLEASLDQIRASVSAGSDPGLQSGPRGPRGGKGDAKGLGPPLQTPGCTDAHWHKTPA